MIILGNVIEPKAAEANSTYPAIIAYVQPYSAGSQQRLQNLTFYCPATMSGHPSEAIFTANSCNIVEAPVYPHNNADPYNYQRGDMIVISYADGNLNSPQFVRYVPLSEDVRTMNCHYLDGAPIVPDGLLQLVSPVTVTSDILKKAYSLLTPMKLCAIGNAFAYDTMIEIIYGLDNPFSNNVVYKKISRYGVELFRTSEGVDNDATTLDGAYIGDSRSPYISFLAIVQYFMNNVETPNNLTIVDCFNTALDNAYGVAAHTTIEKNEKNALALFGLLAGYTGNDYKEYGSLISSSVYNEDSQSQPQVLADQQLGTLFNNGYMYFPERKDSHPQIDDSYLFEVRPQVWIQFIGKYQTELDRAYTIILHNNLWRLRSILKIEQNTISLFLLACIASAYPILEKTVLTIELLDDIENGENYKEYLSQLREWATTGVEQDGIENRVYAYRSAIGNDIGRLVCFRLMPKWGDSEDEQFVALRESIKNNVVLCIEWLVSHKDELFALHNQNTNSSSSSSDDVTHATLPEATIPNDVFRVWPCPPHKTISSPYGDTKDRGGKVHKGVDICSNNGTYKGTPIYAMSGGTIVAVDNRNSSSGYGNYVKIQHNSRFHSLYAHLDSVNVRTGQQILAGEQIGIGGETGDVTGPHLHLEIYDNEHTESDKRVNPLAYISIPNF